MATVPWSWPFGAPREFPVIMRYVITGDKLLPSNKNQIFNDIHMDGNIHAHTHTYIYIHTLVIYYIHKLEFQ